MNQSYLLHYKITGEGPAIVMLHGLAGTSQYFDRITKYLSGKRVIRIDLLGFGDSPKPNNVDYSIQDHISAIHHTLQTIDISKPFTILGISMGAILALEYAKKYPKNIKSIVLVSPTIYTSSLVAKKKISETRAPNVLMFGPVAKFVCRNVCARKKLARRINPAVMRHIPKDVAKTVCEHTWESYSRSMQNIVINQTRQDLSSILGIPVAIIYDKNDNLIEEDYMSELFQERNATKIINVYGGHGMMVNYTPRVADKLNHLL